MTVDQSEHFAMYHSQQHEQHHMSSLFVSCHYLLTQQYLPSPLKIAGNERDVIKELSTTSELQLFLH